jgi:3-oxoadipate enol-lactonase
MSDHATFRTRRGLAADRAAARADSAGPPVVLLHAGIADRRMWNPQWVPVTGSRQAARFDLRGFGDSTAPPDGPLDHVADVIDALDELGLHGCAVVAASMSAGVAVEVALRRPDLVASLLLAAPAGSLITDWTPELRAFADAESAALDAGDLDSAVEANLRWWVDGPHRRPGTVPAALRAAVGAMQRRAFELSAAWGQVEEAELDPPPTTRLAEIVCPVVVVTGDLDLDCIQTVTAALEAGLPDVRIHRWPDVAHLPPTERPTEFTDLILDVSRGSR